jgi:hypothetical protein
LAANKGRSLQPAVAADVDSTQPAAGADGIGLVSAMASMQLVQSILKINSVHDASPPTVAVSTGIDWLVCVVT